GVSDRELGRWSDAVLADALIGDIEEQLVLDDWATEGEAQGLLLECRQAQGWVGDAIEGIADHILVAVGKVGASAELVTPALGHRIDLASDEAAAAGGVGGGRDGDG